MMSLSGAKAVLSFSTVRIGGARRILPSRCSAPLLVDKIFPRHLFAIKGSNMPVPDRAASRRLAPELIARQMTDHALRQAIIDNLRFVMELVAERERRERLKELDESRINRDPRGR
jgi:hypothetical protein